MASSTATPFKPVWGATVSIAATTTTASVAIPANALLCTAVRVNITSGTAGVRFRAGVGAGTAAVAGDPFVSTTGAEAFGLEANATYMAAKTDSGTCTVEFTFGFGS